MRRLRERIEAPWLVATLLVGLLLGGLLVGYEPVGGDPDTMYRPIKAELARALRAGGLPFWSDRFGLGVPLLAESHVAAFYPLNWVFYGLLDVALAYRLAMWLHYVAMTGTMYLYARCLNLKPWGSALAAVTFALCGFQTIHHCHEPFYHALVYLPLALVAAERYLAGGSSVWLAGLALIWGMQLALGHFQLQMWTGGLVLWTGLWRAWFGGRSWRRAAALAGALGWGAAIAAVQLVLTKELVGIAGFDRPYHFLSNYLFPPAHWAQLALPRLFMGLRGGAEDAYWGHQQTTGAEACFYVGTLPLLLAFVGFDWAGLFTGRRDRSLDPWLPLIPLSFALATMPRWWPDGYWALLHVPGLGYFRAPARYTLITSVGLALLAGRGFDRAWGWPRFLSGLGLTLGFAAGACAFSVAWLPASGLAQALGGPDVVRARLTEAALAWTASLVVLLLWRARWLPAVVPLLIAFGELGYLFFQGPTIWGWSVRLPAESPVLARLASERDVELVAGKLENIPVRAGLTPAFPYFGITPPPPNYLLEAATTLRESRTPTTARWMRRFGVTHGIWEGPLSAGVGETLYEGPDEALDRVVPRPPEAPRHIAWRIVRYAGAFPRAHVALKVREAASWYELYPRLSQADARDEAWYLAADRPRDGPEPRARTAKITSWSGRSGDVEHDGTCDLVVRRTYYPGWVARINGGPAAPVRKVDGGLQAVRLRGAGVSRVALAYRPTGLILASAVQAVATFTALGVLASALIVSMRRPASTEAGP